MLYTDSFVFVHAPKTGGTFVTHSIFELYGASYPDFMRWNSRYRWHARFHRGVLARSSKYGGLIHGKRKHSVRSEIDVEHRSKPVLGIVRNPFDWMVSTFGFRWWTKPEVIERFRTRIDLDREFPQFPDLTFEDYLDLRDRVSVAPPVGMLTRRLIEAYCLDPQGATAELAADRLDAARLRKLLAGVTFLHNERLNQELCSYLEANGYATSDVEFIRSKGRVMPDGPGARERRDWRPYYTTALLDRVRQKERLLFELFPQYDVGL